MYVLAGAKEKLGKMEKAKFLEEEWPGIMARIHRLGLEADELLGCAASQAGKATGLHKK